MAYCGVCIGLSSKIGGQFEGLIGSVAFSIGIIGSFLLFPTLILTIIFFVIYLANINKADT